jgi:DNA polymerase III epsilon subunit-like protein
MELARVTVSDQDNTAVYESLVKPDSEVVDLNTR